MRMREGWWFGPGLCQWRLREGDGLSLGIRETGCGDGLDTGVTEMADQECSCIAPDGRAGDLRWGSLEEDPTGPFAHLVPTAPPRLPIHPANRKRFPYATPFIPDFPHSAGSAVN